MKLDITRKTIAILLSFGAVSLAHASVDVYRVHGTVQNVDIAHHKVTLSQGAVSELGWPRRTMTYTVEGNHILTGISTGQTVDATFTTDSPCQATVHFVTPVYQ